VLQLERMAPGDRQRVAVGQVLVDRVDRAAAGRAIASYFEDGQSHQIVTVNLDFLRAAGEDGAFREVINGADLAVADGMPLVWLSRFLHAPIPERVTGFDIVELACDRAVREGLGVFLLGAAPGVAATAAAALKRRHPGLRVAGTYSPPMGVHDKDEEERMVQAVAAAGRCVLLVAFGAPKQDRFIHANLSRLNVPVAIGVGCAFDILAGAVRRAPTWMQRLGLEWAWRLAMEPRRLWRRYLVQDAPFLGRLAAAAVREGLRQGAVR
jgi:N-acetylglucosaminyldiphosphoundecaprenol N-acetyl-beta-D-mannosaminyltransferase